MIDLIITKLSWATIHVQTRNATILVDPLGKVPINQDKPLVAKLGKPRTSIMPLHVMDKPDVILVTHLHADHFDYESIKQSYGVDVPLFVPREAVDTVTKLDFTNVSGFSVGDSKKLLDVEVIATYSIDGFGSSQVAWIIKDEQHSIIHCGDTLRHGYWWRIHQQYGSFDVAFLPINGAVLNVKGLRKQSKLPACLTPEEANEAAEILGAKNLVPIHFGTFHHPPHYQETENCIERLLEVESEVVIKVLNDGEKIELYR